MSSQSTLPAIWLARVNQPYRAFSYARRGLTKTLSQVMIPLRQMPAPPLEQGQPWQLRPFTMAQRVQYIHLSGPAQEEGIDFFTGKGRFHLPISELGAFLAQFPQLRCVCLEGCATPALLQELLRRDVPAILALYPQEGEPTPEKISETFYQRLAAGDSIRDAFQVVKYQHQHMRNFRVDYEMEEDRMSWLAQAELGGAIHSGLYFLREHASRLTERAVGRFTLPLFTTSRVSYSLKKWMPSLVAGILGMCIAWFTLKWQAQAILSLVF